jgi:hypothetical protein
MSCGARTTHAVRRARLAPPPYLIPERSLWAAQARTPLAGRHATPRIARASRSGARGHQSTRRGGARLCRRPRERVPRPYLAPWHSGRAVGGCCWRCADACASGSAGRRYVLAYVEGATRSSSPAAAGRARCLGGTCCCAVRCACEQSRRRGGGLGGHGLCGDGARLSTFSGVARQDRRQTRWRRALGALGSTRRRRARRMMAGVPLRLPHQSPVLGIQF